MSQLTPLGVYLRGVLMGAADIVPGVSGGTIAFITGIYDTLLGSIRAFDLELLAHLCKLDIKGVVDAAALVKAGVIRRELDGVRLIGNSGFTAKKVTFKVAHASKGALAAIEAAGGKVDMPQAEEPKADA